MKRRDFLATSGASLASLASSPLLKAEGKPEPEAKDWPLVAFEKPIQTLPYDRMGEILAEMGMNGIEATIRPGGHIEPREAEEKVPQMVADLAKNDQKAHLVATRISEITPENEKFLLTLKENGITTYRSDYYRYDYKRELLPQVKEFAVKAKEIAAFNKENGLQAIYQFHSGYKLLGGLSWDLALLLEEIDPQHFGVGMDLRHFRTDSGLSWKVSVELMRKHIQALYVKDAVWSGERSDKLKSVPLDTGFVNKEVFDLVRKDLSPMPISLHMEWGLKPIYPADRVMEAVENITRDAKTLQGWMKSS